MKKSIFLLAIGLFIVFVSSLNAAPIKVLFLGDSLTEGYGIDKKKAYPSVVKEILSSQGIEIEIHNGSVSGSTTASCLSRLRWFSKVKPSFAFIALGGNDGLRGIKVASSLKSLKECSAYAQKLGITVMLSGMMVPPNYGPDYTTAFKNIYPTISKELGVKLMPFLLVDVAGEQKLNQEDGIHPNIEGHRVMGKNVAAFMKPILLEKNDSKKKKNQ